MGLGFRKSFKVAKGVRLNVSKSGLGVSAGVKGFRVGANSRGTYTSASIPGTGLYARSYSSSGAKSGGASSGEVGPGCLVAILVFIGFIWIIAEPASGIFVWLIGGAIYYTYNKQPVQQVKQKIAKAKKLLAKDKHDEAMALLKEAKNLKVADPQSILRLAVAFHDDVQEYSEAAELLETYLKDNPENWDVTTVLAHCCVQKKAYKEATKLLQHIPEDYGGYIGVIQLLGECFFEQEKYELAVDVYKKAPLQKRKLDSDLISIHYSLALTYEKLGDKKKALKHFNRVYAEDITYENVEEKIQALE